MGSYNHFTAAQPNTTNNANFQHKQRQLSYSPNIQASKMGGGIAKPGKKRNISETGPVGQSGTGPNLLGQGIDPLHMNQVPSRRSQSKNDKYKDQGDISGGLGLGSFGASGGNHGGKLG